MKPTAIEERRRQATAKNLDDLTRRANLSAEASLSLRKWLAEQLVAQEFAKLGQGGHKQNEVPLRRVFVDLPFLENQGMSMRPGQQDLFLEKLSAARPVDLRRHLKTLIGDATEDRKSTV